MTDTTGTTWTHICDASLVHPERAVAAMSPDGQQVAIVRIHTGELFAVGHHDPYAMSNVIARGVVGTRTIDEQTYDVIQSPLYKQAFDLRTGEDVANRDVRIGTWQVRENDGAIELGAQLTSEVLPEQTAR